jgi:hypothetical protein
MRDAGSADGCPPSRMERASRHSVRTGSMEYTSCMRGPSACRWIGRQGTGGCQGQNLERHSLGVDQGAKFQIPLGTHGHGRPRPGRIVGVALEAWGLSKLAPARHSTQAALVLSSLICDDASDVDFSRACTHRTTPAHLVADIWLRIVKRD